MTALAIAVVTMVSAATVTPRATAAVSPEIAVVAHPTDLRPAGRARVAVRVENLGVCRLTLRLIGGSASASSLMRPARRAELVWEWTVPATIRTGRWTGRVECWQANVSSSSGRAIAESFEGRVAGRRNGTGLVADRELITAAATPVSKRSLLERGSNLATIVAGVIGVMTLPLILASLMATRRGTRSGRTATITDRYLEDTFTKAWDKVKPYLVVADEGQCVDRIRLYEGAAGNDQAIGGKSGPTPNDIDTVVYLYELIGALFNRREIDRPLVNRTFGWPTVDTLSSTCCWWLHYLRDGRCVPVRPHFVRAHESETYAEWERMARAILRKRPELRLRVQKNAHNPVRALCLPTRNDTPPDWGQCKALSCAVGQVVRRPDGLRDLRAAIDDELEHRMHASSDHLRFDVTKTVLISLAQEPPAPRTILMPAWEERASAPWRVTARIARAGAWLDGRGRDIDWVMRPRWLRWVGVRLTRIDKRVGLHESYADCAREFDRLRAVLDAPTVSKLVADA